MYNKHFLSVIIATSNAASDLQRTLDSFSSLSERVQIIIQDGGSTDNTCAVAASFSQHLSISIESKKDTGIYDAWNKALERVSGEWVLFMGAGDTVCSQRTLSEIVSTLQTLPTTCLFYSVPVLSVFAPHEILETIYAAEHPLQELAQGMCLPHQGLFHRRELFNAQKFNTRFRIAGDYDFVCRMLTANNFCKGKEACVTMLFGGISSDMRQMLGREKEFWQISRHYFPHYFPWKIVARAVRCSVHRMVSHIAGERIAGIVSDFPRRLQGKAALWSRQRSPLALPAFSASPLISLLIATLNRREELAFLLHSLRSQSYKNFQIVIADQNGHGYLDALLSEFNDLNIVHKKIPPQGLSQVRNILLNISQGDIIAFPDDDCWYEKETLENVVTILKAYPHAGGVLGRHAEIRKKYFSTEQLTYTKCFFHSETYLHFYRREVIKKVGDFDPILGPGTTSPYGCGEDTDYLLRACALGYTMLRTYAIAIHHPTIDFTPEKTKKIQLYSQGRMYLLKKHHAPLWLTLATIFFPLAMLPRDAVKRKHGALYRWIMFRARLQACIKN